jgi:predicted tellurium resistance membrane protein TerC
MSLDLMDPAIWGSLLSLTALEIVLGIDNIVFLAVLVSRLPAEKREAARRIGLLLAFAMRVLLLLSLFWIISLTSPIATVFGVALSWRDLVLIAGGLFLLAKATHEIHNDMEPGEEDEHGNVVRAATASFGMVIAQLAAIDLVFSIDSIITAIGIAEHVEVMIAAIVIAMLVMYFAATAVGHFIEKHPTTKMLALAFLVLIGMTLIADGFHNHIERGYIYFAMAFAGAVEIINIISRRRRTPKTKT